MPKAVAMPAREKPIGKPSMIEAIRVINIKRVIISTLMEAPPL
jgi:hypothetical protein